MHALLVLLTTIQLTTTSKLNIITGDEETFLYFRGLCIANRRIPLVKSWWMWAIHSLKKGYTLHMTTVGPIMGLMNGYCVWVNRTCYRRTKPLIYRSFPEGNQLAEGTITIWLQHWYLHPWLILKSVIRLKLSSFLPHFFGKELANLCQWIQF